MTNKIKIIFYSFLITYYCLSIIFIYLSNNFNQVNMEIKITNNQILKVLEVLSWIIFIGLCIEAGAMVVNTFISLFITPDSVGNFWKGKEYLSSLYQYDYGYFMVVAIIMCIVAILKAIMFYLIIKMFVSKKLDFYKPFSLELKQFISSLSYLALGIGLFSISGGKYFEFISKQGLQAINLQMLNLEGADVWLFMAVILFIISQIVKKGIEIQTENELTI